MASGRLYLASAPCWGVEDRRAAVLSASGPAAVSVLSGSLALLPLLAATEQVFIRPESHLVFGFRKEINHYLNVLRLVLGIINISK